MQEKSNEIQHLSKDNDFLRKKIFDAEKERDKLKKETETATILGKKYNSYDESLEKLKLERLLVRRRKLCLNFVIKT